MLELLAVYFLTNPLFVVAALVLACIWRTDAPKPPAKSGAQYAQEAQQKFLENRKEK